MRLQIHSMACGLAVNLPYALNGGHHSPEHLNGTTGVQYLEEGSPRAMAPSYKDSILEKVCPLRYRVAGLPAP